MYNHFYHFIMFLQEFAYSGLGILIIISLLIWDDANKRGMEPWRWSLFVFFLPPVGIIMYALLRKEKNLIGKEVI